jgi:phage host-nuclease inhibitor protein Gam
MDLIVVSSSMANTEEESFVDARTASEAIREIGELKRGVADLRDAINDLRWDASGAAR